MKYLIVFALILAAAQGLSKEDQANLRRTMMKNVNECQKESGAKGDDIAQIVIKKTPTKTEGKCFLLCMHQKLGMQDDAGKKNPEGMNSWISQMQAMDADLSENIKKVADRCMTEVDDSGERCDTAALIFDCYIRVSKELGVKMGF